MCWRWVAYYSVLCWGLLCLGLLGSAVAAPISPVRGIYITAGTASHSKKINDLIRRSKAVGIDTFIIDVGRPSKRYARNVARVRQAGLRYVARLVIFPGGARSHARVQNRRIWERRWRRAQYAVSLGASAIQLDYIRYHRGVQPSIQNEKNIYRVIRFFRRRLNKEGVNLQIDIFGVVAHRPTRSIGQNVLLFADSVDAINPMVYPSHYEPYRHHALRPYRTVFDSVTALKKQLSAYPRVKVYAYIELFNYRYPMNWSRKVKYVQAQIRGALQAGADGWYAWSARNQYRILFALLSNRRSA